MVHAFLLPLVVSLLSLVCGYDEAELVFAGDAMMHSAQLDAARRADGTYDYSECFTALEPFIKSAELAVVNLETPVGTPPYAGYPCFSAPESYVSALADAGFDLFLTANNHTLDRRDRGLCNTVAALDRMGLAHLGTYVSDSARRAEIPKVLTVNNMRLGFLNYTYGTNGIMPGPRVVVDYIDPTRIAADVEATRRAGAEFVIVTIHWGEEYHLLPNASQRNLARKMALEMGVDLIIGAHPHVVQPLEYIDDPSAGRRVPVVYSLGNFISNMKTTDTRGGAMARVRLTRDPRGKIHVSDAAMHYIFTLPPDATTRQFRVVPVDSTADPRARQFLKNLK